MYDINRTNRFANERANNTFKQYFVDCRNEYRLLKIEKVKDIVFEQDTIVETVVMIHLLSKSKY